MPDINTKIKLSGEAEYRQALKNINSGMQALNSEMKLATARYADNEKSVEALAAKNDILERSIYSQEEKLKLMRDQLVKTADAYGESSEKTMKLQTAVNDAEAKLISMRTELQKNEEASSANAKALDALNGDLGVLDSELKTVDTQLAGNAKDTDALREKSEILTESIEKQQEKLGILQQQLEETAAAYGEDAEQTKQMQQAVNQAESDLQKMKNSLDKNDQALKDVEKSSGSLGEKLTGLADKLGIKLPESAQKAIDAFGGINAGTALAAGGIALLVDGLVKGTKALVDMTKEAAAGADELLTLSAQTNLSTEDLQKFQYASELLDVSMGTLEGSLTKITKSMADAQGGSEKAQNAFQELGVEITNEDGTLRKANDVFLDAVDALGKVENETQRDAMAMDIFGKSAKELNPLIKAGSQSLVELGNEAEASGYILDDLALNNLGSVDDALIRLDKTRETFTKNMSAQFAPYVTEAITKVDEASKKMGDALVKSGAADAFGKILSAAVDLIVPLSELASVVLPLLTPPLELLAKLIESISSGLSWVINNIGKAADYIGPGNLGGGGNVSPIGNNAAGTTNWRGGWSWVGENGPELINLPQGSTVKTAQESRNVSGDTYNITISAKDVREFNDIVKLSKTARMRMRMEGAG